MLDDGESMESHFLGGLHLLPEMLDFQPLVHPAQWRYVKMYSFENCYAFIESYHIISPSNSFVQTQIISDETWKLIDGIWDKRVEEIRAEASMEVEEDKEKPQLLMASHFL